jgi:hypothetical protein
MASLLVTRSLVMTDLEIMQSKAKIWRPRNLHAARLFRQQPWDPDPFVPRRWIGSKVCPVH